MTRLRSALVLVVVLLVGCAGPPPSPVPAASEAPSTPPLATPATSPVPASDQLPGAGDLPPEAALLVPDGDPVVGQLGSYTWRETGSDAPWLPGTPVAVDAARSLRFALSFDVPVDTWSARYAAPGELSPTLVTPLDIGGAPLEVEPPPAGRWSLAMTITFGDGLGSATYYWQVEVP